MVGLSYKVLREIHEGDGFIKEIDAICSELCEKRDEINAHLKILELKKRDIEVAEWKAKFADIVGKWVKDPWDEGGDFSIPYFFIQEIKGGSFFSGLEVQVNNGVVTIRQSDLIQNFNLENCEIVSERTITNFLKKQFKKQLDLLKRDPSV
jgi:hypothetical protein